MHHHGFAWVDEDGNAQHSELNLSLMSEAGNLPP
jgi:hypothetical protein